MDKKIIVHTMELWLANLPVIPGYVQHGTRPVVIVSNDVAPHRHGRTADEQSQGSNPADARLPVWLWTCGHQHRQVRAGHGVGQVVPHSPSGRGLRLV